MKKLDFICAKLVQNRGDVPQIGTMSSSASGCSTVTVDNDCDENGARTGKSDVRRMESDAKTSEIRGRGGATPDTTESCSVSIRNKRKNFVPKITKPAVNERNRSSQDFDPSIKNEEGNCLSIDEEYEFDDDQDQNGEDSAYKSASKNTANLRTTNRRSCAKTLIDSYIVRFFGSECGAEVCYGVPPREHFHCKLCDFRLFSKKEDMLRHFKWHKKREESMANGFMRFSATDDCSERYENCIHNLRQTHYHCMNKGCCKVYISTSDVQIHSNSHKKAASIAKEGFQRFKNCEDCGYDDCPFHDQSNRTTHFHCLRPGCSHSFKNKADMDKHKTHHQRDDLFYKDGFKKFMKCETCSFAGCAFSRVVNHIHCLKPGCDYILHSTSQMYAHKRKHEKQEKRMAMSVSSAPNQGSPSTSLSSKSCREKSNNKNNGDQDRCSMVFDGRSKRNSSAPSCSTVDDTVSDEICDVNEGDSDDGNIYGGSTEVRTEMMNNMSSDNDDLDQESTNAIDLKTLDQPIKFMNGIEEDLDFKCDSDFTMCKSDQASSQADLNNNTNWMNKSRNDDVWKKYITRYTANDPCKLRCPLMYKDHYHCTADENCEIFFKSKDGVRDHAKQHELLEFASKFFCAAVEDSICNFDQCPYSSKLTHYHCLMKNCSEIISVKESVFRRLEHYKLHEYSNNLGLNSNFQHPNSSPSINYPYNETKFNAVSPHLEPKKDEKIDDCKESRKSIVSDNKISSGQTNFFVGELRRKRGRPPKYTNCQGRMIQKAPTSGIHTLPGIMVSGSSQNSRSKTVVSLKSQRGRPRTVSSPRHPENADSAASVSSNFFRSDDHYHPSSSFGKPLQTDGFTTYLAGDRCPDQLCKLASKLHFHCNQLRCYYSTDQQNVLEMHSQDFHQTFEIPDGFAAYDKMYDCRGGPICPFNGRSRHFHCLRISCDFEPLLKFHDLSAHTNLKHFSSSSPSSSSSSSISSHPQETSNKIIKTADVCYPKISNDKRVSTAEEMYSITSNDACLAEGFAMLSQMAPFFAEFGMIQKRVPYTVERQCGRPFCKLKRRDHFHCSQCHQGFSHYDRLVSHMLKHGLTLPQTQMSPTLNSPNMVRSHQFQVPNLLYNLRPSVINVPSIVPSADSPPSRAANQTKYQVFKASPIKSSSTNKNDTSLPAADHNLSISINHQYKVDNDAKIRPVNRVAKLNIPAKKRKMVDGATQKMANGQLLVQNYDVPISSISPDLMN